MIITFDTLARISQKTGLIIRKPAVVWAVIFLAFVNPAYLDRFAVFGMFTLVVKLMVFGYFLFSGILRSKFPLKILPWIGYAIIPSVVTFMNGGDIKGALVYSFTILSVALIVFFVNKQHVRDMVSGMAVVMEILVMINLATIVLVPNGLYMYETEAGWWSRDVWFFGLRNSHPPFLFFACFASVLDYCVNNGQDRKMRMILTHIIAVTTIILLSSGGGIVSFALYFALIVFLNRKRLDKLKPYVLKIRTAVAINIGIFIFLSFFAAITNVADSFQIIGEQKVYTLGRRIDIWASVWEHIVDAPLFGSGFIKAENLDWLTSLAAGATTSHNSMIDICFRGGLITLIIYYGMLIASGIPIQRNGRISYKLKNYIATAWLTILLLLQTEGAMMSIPLLVTVGVTYSVGNAYKRIPSR